MKYMLLAATALALAAPQARATITFFDAQMPQPSEQTIQFESANLVPQLIHTGDTNKTLSPVIFDTTFTAGPGSKGMNGSGQLFKADGIGQGSLICADTAANCPSAAGGLTNLLKSMEMKPGPGFAWTDAILNTQNGITSGTSMVNVYVHDQFGNNFDDTLKKGENFVTIVAGIDPVTHTQEVITDIQVSQEAGTTGEFGFEKFKQPRVSGVCTMPAGSSTCTPIPIPVPEPAGIAALGVGLCALLLARRAYKARNPNL